MFSENTSDTDNKQRIPYWRLSAFYFFYFAQLGSLLPYLTLYLKEKGFNIEEIGLLTAILMATKVIAPNLWTLLAEKLGSQLIVMRLGAVLSGLVFTSIFFLEGFWQFAVLLFGFSFFRNGILPQIEVMTLAHLGEHSSRYGQVRLWGSVGFIVAVVGLGALFDSLSVINLPYFLAFTMLFIVVASFTIPAPEYQYTKEQPANLGSVLIRKEVVAFLAVCCLIQLSHGPYYTFYTLLLEQQGYSKTIAGGLWALGVFAEVVLFIYIHKLFHRISDNIVLSASIFLTALRWCLIAAFPDSLPILIGAQLLHAASYGSFHAVSMRIVHQYFPGRLETHGQALYASFSFGLGGALGALYAGYSWDLYGPFASYMIAAAGSIAAMGIAMYWIRPLNEKA